MSPPILAPAAVFEVPAGKGYVVGDITQQSDTYFGPIK